MALFSDGPMASIEDLNAYDSSVLEVANTESIDLTRKLQLAQDEIGIELETILPRTTGEGVGPAAEPALANVVVTPPLRLWHMFRTLTLVYRDAYGSQLNDRYQARRDEYNSLAEWARGKLEQTGIGVVWEPIARAAVPQLTLGGGTLGPATVFACVSYLTQSGGEGAAGPAASVDVPMERTISVRPADPPANARSWNVFAGAAADRMVRQKLDPLPLDGQWTAAEALALSGRPPGQGQEPDDLRAAARLLRR